MPHISIATIGKGPAVILIPGLASPRAVWDGVVGDLARTHRVYLVQVNGFAGGDIRENDKAGLLDGIAADLNGYIVANKIKDPAIVGHSIGGLLAMMMGARYPQSTGSVMVVDALPFFSLLFGPTATVEGARPFAEQAKARTLATPPATAPVTSDPGGIWSITPEGRIKVANWGAKADPRVSAEAIYEAMTTDIRPELAKITAKPFTVLYATGAGPQAKALWELGYAGSPAKLVPIADSWHFIMLDQPAAFTQALNAFLGPQ
ncbi:MAG: hypothetical protein B7Y47_14020 [Sphingomonas sp. 28-63-12]|nr:MAG: hypothetical protein B7Y47_14020 [Sphingomonas sp. 28-63-12]